jgi:hypothetical protein
MAKPRRAATATAPRERRRRAVNVNTLRDAAEGFMSRFDGLVAEVVTLREALAASQEENERLRNELAEGVALFRQAEMALGGGTNGRRMRRRGPHGQPVTTTAPRQPRVKRPARSVGVERTSSTRVRATPATVTPEVVRSVIASRGSASAAEIAAEIGKAGTAVSGRAIRHIAKSAGAVARPGADGRMVYSLT